MSWNILLVEDEESVLESLFESLSLSFPTFTIEKTRSAEDAFVLVDKGLVPRLVIADVRLPGRSGVELLLTLSERLPETKFILTSGYDPPDLHGKTEQVLRFLAKPYELTELVTEVQSVFMRDQFSDTHQAFGFLDIIQVLHMARRTSTIELRRGGETVGTVYMVDGEIHHAETEGADGENAFQALAHGEGLAFRVVGGEDPPRRTITQLFDRLLMEAMSGGAEGNQIVGDALDDTLGGLRPADPGPPGVNDFCRKLVKEIPDAVAANVVDLDSCKMLGGYIISTFSREHFEVISTKAVQLFRGPDIQDVEQRVRRERGELQTGESLLEEIQLTSRTFQHFILRLPEREALVCVVLSRVASVDPVWNTLRGLAPQIAAAVP